MGKTHEGLSREGRFVRFAYGQKMKSFVESAN